MVNNVDFIKRLQKVLLHHQLSAANFADLIAVQRSSISHILSGRNKPSLDFVLKVTSKFTDVDLYWLLHGKGSFPAKDTAHSPAPTNTVTENTFSKKIQRIVVFYEDGSFQEYQK